MRDDGFTWLCPNCKQNVHNLVVCPRCLKYFDPRERNDVDEDPLTRPDVTWEELGRGFIEQEPDWEGENDD